MSRYSALPKLPPAAAHSGLRLIHSTPTLLATGTSDHHGIHLVLPGTRAPRPQPSRLTTLFRTLLNHLPAL